MSLKTIFKSLCFSFIPLLLATNVAMAQTILFWDYFDTGSGKWTIAGSNIWNVSTSQEFGGIITSGVTNAIPSNFYWQQSWNNIAFDVDLRGVSGIDKNILIKFKDPNNFYEIHHTTNGNIYFAKLVNGSVTTLGVVNHPLTNGVTYHFRLENYNNSHFRVFEGSNKLFDLDDVGPTFPENNIGLRIGTGGAITEIWYDNVVVTEIPPLPTTTPTQTATPVATQTPSPSPSVTPTPSAQSTLGSFDLPFNYIGRPSTTSSQLKNAFWNKLTAAFDHTFKVGIFRPFTGNTYTSCTVPISCYDSHNGTDFSSLGNQDVLSVAEGLVSYTSTHTSSTCVPEKGGFGCVVIIQYPGNIYGLFAHLDRIYVNSGEFINLETLIGEMGATGCPGCGEHLHFGILKPQSFFSLALSKLMTKKNWQDLLFQIKPYPGQTYKPACTYRAPNGVSFSFSDPSGWKGANTDPWNLPRNLGGCGVSSSYLWKYEIGSTP